MTSLQYFGLAAPLYVLAVKADPREAVEIVVLFAVVSFLVSREAKGEK